MIQPQQSLPSMTLKVVDSQGISERSTEELFGEKKCVLVGVPGAFTSVCTAQHLPGYAKHLDALLKAGIERVIFISVNDPFVMQAWAETADALVDSIESLTFIADYDAQFTRAISADIDLNEAGLGIRSKRFSMIVNHGVVQKVFEEPDLSLSLSSAEKMLETLRA